MRRALVESDPRISEVSVHADPTGSAARHRAVKQRRALMGSADVSAGRSFIGGGGAKNADDESHRHRPRGTFGGHRGELLPMPHEVEAAVRRAVMALNVDEEEDPGRRSSHRGDGSDSMSAVSERRIMHRNQQHALDSVGMHASQSEYRFSRCVNSLSVIAVWMFAL